MKKLAYLFLMVVALSWMGCETLKNIQSTVENGGQGLTESEIIQGLKQALEVGTNNASSRLSKTDGYFKDPLIKIPFPPDAQRAADKLRQLGMNKLVDDFIETLNRGAEEAAKEAAPIFVDAIKAMTVTDAKNILHGPDDAATRYFEKNTRSPLYGKFKPVIDRTLGKVNATKYWGDITTTYNKIPLVEKVNTDLPDYATNKALDGLFLKIEGEEKDIRKNPAARVTDLLKKVFGELDK